MTAPEFWPDDAGLAAFDYNPRAMTRAFVRRAEAHGVDRQDIPNLVFKHVPGAGESMAQDVLAEDAGVEHFM